MGPCSVLGETRVGVSCDGVLLLTDVRNDLMTSVRASLLLATRLLHDPAKELAVDGLGEGIA